MHLEGGGVAGHLKVEPSGRAFLWRLQGALSAVGGGGGMCLTISEEKKKELLGTKT